MPIMSKKRQLLLSIVIQDFQDFQDFQDIFESS